VTPIESGLMPHFRCSACKTRLYSPVAPTDQVGDLCPECGSLLEPVAELADVVGFRSIRYRDRAADETEPGRHRQIADRVDDFFARREAIDAQAQLDADRWADDGGSFSPEPVAEAITLPARTGEQ
jgi:hypothetical protein